MTPEKEDALWDRYCRLTDHENGSVIGALVTIISERERAVAEECARIADAETNCYGSISEEVWVRATAQKIARRIRSRFPAAADPERKEAP